MFKLLVLLSGKGTNLQYLIDNIIYNQNGKQDNKNIEIIGAIYNKKNAYVVKLQK